MHVHFWTWAKAFGLSVLAIVAPAKPLLVAALVLVCFDSVSGIMAARKRGEKITSAGLRRTISKGLVYTLALLSSFVAEKFLMGDLLPVSKLVAGAIGIIECKSVLENLETVLGQPVFAAIIGKIGSNNDPKSGDAP